jgi:hypothetical protein
METPVMARMRRSGMLRALALIWAGGLTIHLVLRLPDLRLWIAFPLLLAPWLLFGRQTWFDP